MRKTKMIRSGDSFLFISDEPLTSAEHITAEYLLRHVPEEPLPRVDEYVSPFRFIAGWVVVLALVGLIWGIG